MTEIMLLIARGQLVNADTIILVSKEISRLTAAVYFFAFIFNIWMLCLVISIRNSRKVEKKGLTQAEIGIVAGLVKAAINDDIRQQNEKKIVV